jgi:hypothetical protein
MHPPVLPGIAAPAEDASHSTKRQRVDGNLPHQLHYDSMNPNRVGAQIR